MPARISMVHLDWGATASLKWTHRPLARRLGFAAPSLQAERAPSTRHAAAAAGAGTQALEVAGERLREQKHKLQVR